LLFVITRGPSTKGADLAGASAQPSTGASVAMSLRDSGPSATGITSPAAWTALPVVPSAPEKRTTAPAQLAPVAPRPRPGPNTAPPAAVGPVAPPAAPGKPNCNPPYEFDADGNKRWKRECL
jgi:hypothetical protein